MQLFLLACAVLEAIIFVLCRLFKLISNDFCLYLHIFEISLRDDFSNAYWGCKGCQTKGSKTLIKCNLRWQFVGVCKQPITAGESDRECIGEQPYRRMPTCQSGLPSANRENSWTAIAKSLHSKDREAKSESEEASTFYRSQRTIRQKHGVQHSKPFNSNSIWEHFNGRHATPK